MSHFQKNSASFSSKKRCKHDQGFSEVELKGVRKLKCNACGYLKTPFVEHSHNFKPTSGPDSNGRILMKCEECGLERVG